MYQIEINRIIDKDLNEISFMVNSGINKTISSITNNQYIQLKEEVQKHIMEIQNQQLLLNEIINQQWAH